jgi:chemotaxis response regulator CheB
LQGEQDSTPRGQETAERRSSLRVLVVDDSPEIRHLLEVALSRIPACHLVGEAEDGRQAIEKVELLRPDLVIMDMKMPVMDGPTTAREITSCWPAVTIVGFTSAGYPEGHRQMTAAGAAQSFDKSDLRRVLDFVRERAAERAVTSFSSNGEQSDSGTQT